VLRTNFKKDNFEKPIAFKSHAYGVVSHVSDPAIAAGAMSQI
jgi:hypothetical protein